jgi:hypothetical protein
VRPCWSPVSVRLCDGASVPKRNRRYPGQLIGCQGSRYTTKITPEHVLHTKMMISLYSKQPNPSHPQHGGHRRAAVGRVDENYRLLVPGVVVCEYFPANPSSLAAQDCSEKHMTSRICKPPLLTRGFAALGRFACTCRCSDCSSMHTRPVAVCSQQTCNNCL